jgi:indoleamine 2,3-dioxygenase
MLHCRRRLQPQQLYGETGAQSPILHALDAALGIRHEASSWLAAYLRDMRAHMPPAHRAFIARLEAGPSLRSAAEAAPRALKVSAAGRCADSTSTCDHAI